MRITKATRKVRAVCFWTALMVMLAASAGKSAAQGTDAAAKPAAQATAATVKPAVQPPAATAKPAVQPPAATAKPAAQPVAVTAKPAVQPPAATARPAAQPPDATAKPAAQPAPQQEEAFRYNPEGRIDPFRPFADLDAAEKQKMEKSKAPPLSPLQRLGIEQFRLVGIIERNKSRRAMVQDPSGKFYSLVRGSYIGLNRGRVTAIQKDSVIVQERITTETGKIESRKQVMKLRQDEVKP